MGAKATLILAIVFAGINAVFAIFSAVYSWAYNDALNVCLDWAGYRVDCDWYKKSSYDCDYAKNLSHTGLTAVLLCLLSYLVIVLIAAFALAKEQHRVRRNYRAVLTFWIIACVSSVVNIAVAIRFMTEDFCHLIPSYSDRNFQYGPAFGLMCAALSVSTIALLFFIFMPWEKRKTADPDEVVEETEESEDGVQEVEMGTIQ